MLLILLEGLEIIFSINFLQKEVLRNKSIIYKALLKYGHSNFTLEILEYCDPSEVIQREQYYFDLYKPEYNICQIAGSSLGRVSSDETRLKLRNAWLLRLYKNNSFNCDITLSEFILDNLTERVAKLELNIAKIQKKFTEITTKKESKVSMETRMKILASTKTSQAVFVTDLINGNTTKYPSARRAAETLGISNSTIMNKLNHKNNKPYKRRYLIESANK